MTYFTKNFSTEIILPDGTVATSPKDIDRYLKASGLALQSDYSVEYMQKIRRNKERDRRRQIRAELIKQYKKGIWDE